MTEPAAPKPRKVLLIGWDAADWEHIHPLLDEGLLPALEGLINRGVMGNLATLHPVLSPMLWNSVATGKLPDKHGILGFIEPDPVNGGARPYTSTSRKTKALWNILTQAGLRSNIIGWWASHPAEPIHGNVVTNAFGSTKFDPEKGWAVPPGTIHPPEKSAQLGKFKVFPNELTEAHILPFIPNAARIDQDTDRRLESFAKILTDASSIHAVATALMECEPWDFTAVYYDAVDHFSHGFMQYHPPKLSWVSDEDFEIYRDVIRGAYRFHDMMLARLLELAGPETTVILCSDHGFESGSQRPRGIPREPAGPAIWHRQYGIVVIAGPGIKQDERIYGASLIDIAPTVLTLFGLPLGEDMDGRPLLEAFETPPAVKAIPSWDAVEGEAGMHAEGRQLDRDQARELMQQFAALGYIEDPNADSAKQAESAEIEAKYNLSLTHLWKNRPEQAIPLLEEVTRRRPWEDRFLIQLAAAYFRGGYFKQTERLLTAAYDLEATDSAMAVLLFGRVKLALGETEAGLKHLLRAEGMDRRLPSIYTHIGDVYLRLGRLEEAKGAFEKAISLDEDNAIAYQGLSNVYRRRWQNQETADAALHAVSLLHRLPGAHFNLGVAMARSGQFARARVALETALRFQPQLVNAHRYLAVLHGLKGGDREKARFHRDEVLRLAGLRRNVQQRGENHRDQLFELPTIPPRAERLATLVRERPDQKKEEPRSGKTFTLVSGLPRSGTSLLMQMLQAGGLPPQTDHERAADIDNPEGYLEWEAIKRIAKEPELLDEPGLESRAIKVISMLLPSLPRRHRYRVLFMQRPPEEIARSQAKMIARRGTGGIPGEEEAVAEKLRAHREDVLRYLRNLPDIYSVLEIDYPSLVAEPENWTTRIADFVGAESLPSLERMAGVVRRDLHRNKAAASGA